MSEILLTGAINGANVVDQMLGPALWIFDGHVRIGAYHDEQAGLDSTLRNPHTFFSLIELDGKTTVRFDPFSLPAADRCGTYQVDVERFAGDSGADATFSFANSCGILHDPSTVTPTPESGTLVLFAMGLAALVVWLKAREAKVIW